MVTKAINNAFFDPNQVQFQNNIVGAAQNATYTRYETLPMPEPETTPEKVTLLRVLYGKIAEDFEKDPDSWHRVTPEEDKTVYEGYWKFTKGDVTLIRYPRNSNYGTSGDSWALAQGPYDSFSQTKFSERMNDIYKEIEDRREKELLLKMIESLGE
jgi:hypothetical protein